MRLVLTSLLMLTLMSSQAGAEAAPPPSAANLLRVHPGAWRMPAPPVAALRFEPEAGELPLTAIATGSARAADLARARAEAAVRIHSDGSRHAVVGSALRRWTVASIDETGRLVQDCVHSEAAARLRVEAAAALRLRK